MNGGTKLQRLLTAASLAALALESAKFMPLWHESRMTGTIVLRGSASQELQVTVGWFPAQLLAGDTPTLGPAAPTTASFKVGRSKFKRSVDVSGLFPGRLELAGYGRAGSEIYAIPGRVVVLAPPPEGVIGRAYVSATEHGRPVKHLPAGSKAIYAHYICSPGGFIAHVFAKHGKKLPSGTFHHVLRVLDRPVAQVSVRVG